MRRSRTTWTAWGLGGPGAALAVAAVVLAAGNGEQPGELVANHHAVGIVTAIGLGILGAMIAARRPGNPIGWLMAVGGLSLGVFSFTQQYGPLAAAHSLPGVAAARAGWRHGPTCPASPSPAPWSSSCSPTGGCRRPAGGRWPG
jgi:hypothetical protein